MAMQQADSRFDPLHVPTKEEIGERIKFVRRGAGLTGRQLANLLQNPDEGVTSKLERGLSIDFQRMLRIANVCSGRGGLTGTGPQEIMDFLEARTDELKLSLNGSSTQMSYYGAIQSPLMAIAH